VLDPDAAPPRQFALRVSELIGRTTLTVTQGTATVWSKRFGPAIPNRSLRVDGGWAAAVRAGPPLRWTLGR
jgi:hypothetical protein